MLSKTRGVGTKGEYDISFKGNDERQKKNLPEKEVRKMAKRVTVKKKGTKKTAKKKATKKAKKKATKKTKLMCCALVSGYVRYR